MSVFKNGAKKDTAGTATVAVVTSGAFATFLLVGNLHFLRYGVQFSFSAFSAAWPWVRS